MLPILHNLSEETIRRIHTREVREPDSELIIPRTRKDDILNNENIRVNTWKTSSLFYAALRLTRSPFLKHNGRVPANSTIIYTTSLDPEFACKVRG